MFENIEIKSKELKQLLIDYYKNTTKDECISISFKTSEELVGFYESKSIVTRIRLKQNLKLGSQIISKEREINNKELKDVLNEILSEQDYEVVNLYLDNQKNSVGYYEDVCYQFAGIKLDVRKKQKQKQKVR